MNKDIKKNVVLNIIYDILLIICPFITAPYISRVLSASGVGVYSLSVSIVSYFTLFAGLGTAMYGKREIARNRDDKELLSKTFFEIELLTIITSFISILAWGIICIFAKDYTLYFIPLFFNILTVCFDISWLYTGLEKYKYNVIVNGIIKILTVVLTFVLVKSEKDIYTYFYIMSIGSFLGSLSMWLFLPKVVTKTKIKLSNIKTHFKETLVYFVPTIASTLYAIVDKTLIGVITKDNNQNGYYEQASKLVFLFKVIAYSSINAVMNSRCNYLYSKNDSNGARELSLVTLKLTSFLSVGICFGLISISSNFIPLFFGEEYSPAAVILCILSPILILMCISDTVACMYYTPSGRRKQSAIYLVFGTIFNIVLNLLLIPFLGANGAAISSLLGEVFILVLYFKNCNGFMNIKDVIKIFWKKIIAGLIMVCACYSEYIFLKELVNPFILLVIQVIFGFIIYIIVLSLLKDNSLKELINFIFKGDKKDGEKIR